MKKILVTIGVLAIAGLAFFYLSQSDNDPLGDVTILVIDANDDLVIEDTLTFEEDDSLMDLLMDTYTIYCGDAQYKPDPSCDMSFLNGRVLLGIETVETDWYNTYISIYVDDVYSPNGIDTIALKNGAVYRFEYTVIGE